MAEEKKWEKKKMERDVQATDDPAKAAKSPMEKKAEAILNSSMPEAQKQAYLREIGYHKESSDEGKVPLHVYVTVKKVAKHKHGAMQVYPKAQGVRLASIEEWDEIFKDF